MMLVMTSVAQLLALLVLKLVKNMIFRSRGFWPRRAILGMNRVRGGSSKRPASLSALGGVYRWRLVSSLLGAVVGEFDSDI